MFITGFFLSLLHLKADDTYLQLKKDLEYLDLKVSGLRGLAFLGHFPFGECQPHWRPAPKPKALQVLQIWVSNEDVSCLNQKGDFLFWGF